VTSSRGDAFRRGSDIAHVLSENDKRAEIMTGPLQSLVRLNMLFDPPQNFGRDAKQSGMF
jgi:hypothetical protein